MLDLHEALVLKLRHGPAQLPPLADYTARRLYYQGARFRAVQIAAVPDAFLELESSQHAASEAGLVQCEFHSHFEQPIEVSLDRRLFSFVTQVLSKLSSQPSTNPLFSPASGRVSSEGVGPMTGKVPSQAPHKGKREFKCKKFHLEPQFSVLQDVNINIVSVLGLLGITSPEGLVAAMHEGMLDPLDRVFRHIVARLPPPYAILHLGDCSSQSMDRSEICVTPSIQEQ
mmetsp:Transcript_64973/g.174456  ORF Transcript_64973/g.174456 Transcript_64973/m.174456 type:complete len:228 (+) Transcript_64973:3988-4671(+)